jgi:hypothetical protein
MDKADEPFGLAGDRVASWFIFKPKIPFWALPRMEIVGIFYVHVEYITAIWYILWSLGNFVIIWCIVSRKIWQPCWGVNQRPGSHKQSNVPQLAKPDLNQLVCVKCRKCVIM